MLFLTFSNLKWLRISFKPTTEWVPDAGHLVENYLKTWRPTNAPSDNDKCDDSRENSLL